jgi:hypothetical protein
MGGDEGIYALLPGGRPQRPQLTLAAVQRHQPALYRRRRPLFTACSTYMFCMRRQHSRLVRKALEL